MSVFLKNHPFAVEAFFRRSTVLTFSVPKEELQQKIPECLELDTFKDKWAFIAVAMVETRDLRPKGFPKWIGNDFFLIGFRVFVRYKTSQGKSLRGLYILKSATDKKKMQWMGNIFTHYDYSTADIDIVNRSEYFKIISKKLDINIDISNQSGEVKLPENSPFQSWDEARRFAGPLPFTFTYDTSKKAVLIIEGVRQNWKPKPVKIDHCQVGYIKELGLENSVLANAFIIENIPYYWKKGKLDKWVR